MEGCGEVGRCEIREKYTSRIKARKNFNVELILG